MKNFIIILGGCFLFLSGCASSQPTVDKSNQNLYQYSNDEEGYSFSLERPAGWDEIQRGRTIVGFVPEADQTMAMEMFGVYVDDLRDDPLTFDEYTGVYKGLLIDGGLVDELVEESDLSLAGTSAKKMVYVDVVKDESGNQLSRIKTQEIWGMVDGLVFSLVYHADEVNFDRFWPAVNEAIESFQFEVKK